MSKAIVLFSGGLDSTTCLYLARKEYDEVIALSFDYGQRHIVELRQAKKIASKLNLEHLVIKISQEAFLGSALTQEDIEVPNYRVSKEIPATYVPARNTIFIAYALGIAESRKANSIYIGVSSVDYSGYPDCRPEYIESYQKLINNAIQGQEIKLETPLLKLTKKETVAIGLKLGVNYDETISCYRADANGLACGTCDSCVLRKKAFKDA